VANGPAPVPGSVLVEPALIERRPRATGQAARGDQPTVLQARASHPKLRTSDHQHMLAAARASPQLLICPVVLTWPSEAPGSKLLFRICVEGICAEAGLARTYESLAAGKTDCWSKSSFSCEASFPSGRAAGAAS
jgi:hypothetical protein